MDCRFVMAVDALVAARTVGVIPLPGGADDAPGRADGTSVMDPLTGVSGVHFPELYWAARDITRQQNRARK
jgi:hypothetical protein